MPFPGFEAACLAIVVLALAALARTRPWRRVIADYLGLAVAGWLGEHTCVAWYDFYHYAPAWHGRLGTVPPMIPIIWPLVILSARAVIDAVAPSLGRWRPLAVAALVVFDASLVEVVAVRASLWSWVEPGHLGVPVIGILGWGCFAGAADVALAQPPRWRPVALLAAVGVTHALIVGLWWGLFRWIVRGDLGDVGLVVMIGLGLAGAWVARSLRRRDRALPLDVALPRMIAASVFVATLLVVAPDAGRLWLHTACVAAPYLALTSFTGRR